MEYDIYCMSAKDSDDIAVVAARDEEVAKSLLEDHILDGDAKLMDRFNKDAFEATDTGYKSDGEVVIFSRIIDAKNRENPQFYLE